MTTGAKLTLAALAGLGILLLTRKAAAAATTDVLPPMPSSDTLLQTVGKAWILTNKIAQSGKAANYGWHFPGKSFGGLAFEASVSLPNVRVIQGIGTKHDRYHTDYSQTCVLASQSCIYQGQERLLSDLLVDPEASKLLSVEGPLQIVRQPGVAQLDPTGISPGGASPLTRADVAALPSDPLAREPILLGWLDQGLGEYSFADITTGDLTFRVFSDALKFGGVRVCVSATLQQQIADKLSCSLLTARMADLTFQSASKVITPFPLPYGPDMASTKWMLDESDLISQAAAT